MKASKLLVNALTVLAWTVLGGALLMIGMDVPFVSIPIQMVVTLGIHLLAGWYLFASEMLTRVEFHGAFWVKSVLGLLLTSVCLDLILRAWKRRKAKGTATWRMKWSLGIAGILMVLFGISISIWGTMAAMKWLGKSEWSADRGYRTSVYGLYDMGVTYAQKPPATLPDNLPDLLSTGKDMSMWQRRSALFPVASVWEAPEYWTWLGGVPLNGAEDLPIAFAPRLNEDGTRIVLFLGGITENCTEEEWQAALERWRQAVKTNKSQKMTEVGR